LDCIGGMRSPWRSIRKLPCLAWAAKKVRDVLEKEFEIDGASVGVVDLLGKDVAKGSEEYQWLKAKARSLSIKLVKVLNGQPVEKEPRIGGAWNVELVNAFITASKDPEVDLVGWLRSGCPAGVAREITACGIFPATEEDSSAKSVGSWQLVDEEPASNYKSVEEAAELSGAEVDRLIEKGYAVKHDAGRTWWSPSAASWCPSWHASSRGGRMAP
jgi:hypothetical protein